MLGFFLLFLACLCIVVFVRVLITMKRIRAQALIHEIRVDLITRQQLAPAVVSRMDGFAHQLEALGFDHARYFGSSGGIGASHQAYALNTNSEAATVAQTLAFAQRIAGAEVHQVVTGFLTQTANGLIVATSNRATPHVLARDPRIDTVRWPGMNDLSVLFTLHRARVRDVAVSSGWVNEVAVDGSGWLLRMITGGIQVLVDRGMYVHDAAMRQYQLTVRGAWRAILLDQTLARRILRSSTHKRLERALASAGMNRAAGYSPTATGIARSELNYFGSSRSA